MFGIVIWYDQIKRVGIVWCEDQKDLAVMDQQSTTLNGGRDIVAGDRFYFRDVRVEGIRIVDEIEHFFGFNNAGQDLNPADFLKHPRQRHYRPNLQLV